jgi:hypothetical protein
MKVHTLILTLILSLHSLFVDSQNQSIKHVDLISQENLIQTTSYLSSTKYKGRLPGSHEYEMAARYVANRFKESGLKPVGSKSFLHFFDVEYNQISEASMCILYNEGDSIQTLELGKDFNCRGFTGANSVSAPLVFVGYGIDSKIYNDYADVDVNGKIVVAFKSNPTWKHSGEGWDDLSPRGKARMAEKHGAIGIILISTPKEADSRDLIGSIACGAPPHLDSFPMVQVSKKNVTNLFSQEETDFISVYNDINANATPSSFPLKTIAKIDIKTSYSPNKPTPNIVAIFEGTDKKLKNEYIILGAHLDHVGSQGNDLIYPGANDNASGVATLIEIADVLKKAKIKTKRSIVFVVFSAEESGMHGSINFVENSPIELDKTIAMLNFDCVAQGDSIALGGKLSFPNLWEIAKELDKSLTKNLSINTFGGGGADAEAFYQKGIPTLYFNTSAGYKYLHLPTDTPETLNPYLFERLTKLGLATIIELANGNYKGEPDMLKTKK